MTMLVKNSKFVCLFVWGLAMYSVQLTQLLVLCNACTAAAAGEGVIPANMYYTMLPFYIMFHVSRFLEYIIGGRYLGEGEWLQCETMALFLTDTPFTAIASTVIYIYISLRFTRLLNWFYTMHHWSCNIIGCRVCMTFMSRQLFVLYLLDNRLFPSRVVYSITDSTVIAWLSSVNVTVYSHQVFHLPPCELIMHRGSQYHCQLAIVLMMPAAKPIRSSSRLQGTYAWWYSWAMDGTARCLYSISLTTVCDVLLFTWQLSIFIDLCGFFHMLFSAAWIQTTMLLCPSWRRRLCVGVKRQITCTICSALCTCAAVHLAYYMTHTILFEPSVVLTVIADVGRWIGWQFDVIMRPCMAV